MKINTKEICNAQVKVQNAESEYNGYRFLQERNPESMDVIDAAHMELARSRRYDALSEFNKASEPINDAIRVAEGRATARTIDAVDVCRALERIDGTLPITKKAKTGIKVHVDVNAQKFPSAYRYMPESTHFEAEFKGGAWIITDIHRGRCQNPGSAVQMTLTPEAEQALLQSHRQFEL